MSKTFKLRFEESDSDNISESGNNHTSEEDREDEQDSQQSRETDGEQESLDDDLFADQVEQELRDR